MNLKKTLVAAAVAAVAAAPAISHASPTLYGGVHLSLSQSSKAWNDGKIGTTNYNFKSQTAFGDDASRIGVKGSDSLGNGLTGLYQIELGLNAVNNPNSASNGTSPYSDPSASVHTRLGYMGVKGNFGTVVAGRVHGLLYSFTEAPTDVTNYLPGALNPIGATSSLGAIYGAMSSSTATAQSVTTAVVKNAGLGGYKSRVDAAAYISPTVGGFSGGIAYADIGTYNNNTSSSNGKQQGVWQIGGKYTFGPGYVSAVYMSIPKDNQNVGFVKSVAAVAAGYSFGMFSIDGNYQQAKPQTSGPMAITGTNNNKNIQSAVIQGSMSMGQLYAFVQYSQLKWKYISDKTAQRTSAGVFYTVAKPLLVTFEVQQNNKYANSSLVPGSDLTGLVSTAPTPKASTTVALGVNYSF